jgi:hypothetical protein
MLRSLHGLLGSSIQAVDGEIGKAHDFFFDDRTWRVRYLVVETGAWLNRSQVLLSPSVLGTPDWTERVFPINLTKQKVQNSPDVDTEKPVSRQKQISLSQYFGWPLDWSIEPAVLPASQVSSLVEEQAEGDPDLRSARVVSTYSVWVTEGELGRVDDFIIDDGDWAIRYFVVHTGSWFAGQKLLVSTLWAESVSWDKQQVKLSLHEPI